MGDVWGLRTASVVKTILIFHVTSPRRHRGVFMLLCESKALSFAF